MHGRLKVKTTKEKELEQKIKDRERAYHFKFLADKLFSCRDAMTSGQCLDEALKLSQELLLLNPDFYTAWNIRKEALLSLVDSYKKKLAKYQDEFKKTSQLESKKDIPDQDADSDDNVKEKTLEQQEEVVKSINELWKEELSYTIQCLQKNEKSYSVWQHRIWILSNMSESEYKNELKLCSMFLSKDERNFHCWDYRNYISDLAKSSIEDEMEFTTEMIKSNFSNFSAWHRRHKLFLKAAEMSDDSRPDSCDLILRWEEEYKLVLEAIFTDPSDQSPWKYHNFLVRYSHQKLSLEHLKLLNELLELEPNNIWVKNGVAFVEQKLNQV